MSNLDGYKFLQQPIKNKTGGGVAIGLKENLLLKKNPLQKFCTFEYMDVCLRSDSKLIRLIVIYSPPKTKASEITQFFSEFSTLIEVLSVAEGHLVVTGDFNLQLDQGSARVVTFKCLLSSVGLIQHICVETHIKGHILDLLISRQCENLISSVKVSPYLPSDHYVITCGLAIPRPSAPRQIRIFRQLKAIDISSFCEDIKSSPLILHPADDLNNLVAQYDDVLLDILNETCTFDQSHGDFTP